MNWETFITIWLIAIGGIIYHEVNKYEDSEVIPLSKCHKAPVMEYKDRHLCMECEKWCELYER